MMATSLILTLKEFEERAKKLYGKDRNNWIVACTNCGQRQSINSIKAQMAKNRGSMRYGVIKVDDKDYHVLTQCYSSICDHLAMTKHSNTGILVVFDPEKAYDPSRAENCNWIFPLADDIEMQKAARLE